MKKTLLATIVISTIGIAASTAFAGSYGTEITQYDNKGTQGTAPLYEDNETEPGMLQSQHWDLEGFFLNGNVLTMIGGFNFREGVSGYNGLNGTKDFTSGDVFISTNSTYGRPLSGTMYEVDSNGVATTTVYNPLDNTSSTKDGQKNVNSSFGYEYVLDINWAALTFSIVKLDPDDATTSVYYHQNEEGSPSSNPWKYFKNGEIIGQQGTVTDLGTVTDSGFAGMDNNNTHYAVSFDLSNFFSVAGLHGKDFYTHFTMGCGNDNLMGHGSAPVPEPATLFLFGTGMATLGAFSRRRKSLTPRTL